MPDDVPIEVADTAPLTLFGTSDPQAVVERATAVATALADILKKRKLVKKLGSNEYVLLEGWTLLGSMLGVFAHVEWTRPVVDGWEARGVVRTLAGAAVGSAEAMCTSREPKWAHQEDYAIRSMAQTRALAKALRMPLGFIVELAGYAATPAEEMPEPAAPPASTTLTRAMVEQRVRERAHERSIEDEVLDDLIDSRYEGRTLAQLTKDELIGLGTAITKGAYDPFVSEGTKQPEAGERTPEASSQPVGTVAGNSDATIQPPVEESGSGPGGTAPAIQAVLDLTGGTLEQPAQAGEPAAAGSGEVHSLPAADDVAERVERARKRAVAT